MLRFGITAAVLLLASISACAQYTIDKIVFHDGAPYTDTELLSASGLQSGQMLAHDSLSQAAQHLLDTGLFDDAEISLSGQGKARTVLLALKPMPLAKLIPASFENFVWFTPEELGSSIHSRVPLYRGAFSDAGNFADTVQAALQQMLAAKGIAATVSHVTVEPTTQHPQRVVDFKIEQPSVRLTSATLTGTPSDISAEAIKRYQARLSGMAYNEGLSGTTVEDRLLSPWRNLGYIAARLDGVQRTPAATAEGIGVLYTASLQAGAVYTVAGLTWTATPVYSDADFARDTKLHSGQIAGSRLLDMTEASILAAYRSQGYLDAYLDAAPKLDDTAHTVIYALHAIAGEQYHLKSVTPLNLSPEAQKEFDSGWRMKPGDLYNERYVQTFINNNTALQHLATYSASFQASADPQTHLVDLTITFVRGAGAR